jgi:hypothetical protein
VRSSNLEERGENGAFNISCHLADKMREISGERGETGERDRETQGCPLWIKKGQMGTL